VPELRVLRFLFLPLGVAVAAHVLNLLGQTAALEAPEAVAAASGLVAQVVPAAMVETETSTPLRVAERRAVVVALVGTVLMAQQTAVLVA
jgi:hypothetical protein